MGHTHFLHEHGLRVLRALRHFARVVKWPPLVERGNRPGVNHACDSNCMMISEPQPPPTRGTTYVYICATSGHVHLCTSVLCRYTRDITNTENEDGLCVERACMLTGTTYPAHLMTESVLTRVSHVPDPETDTRRMQRQALEVIACMEGLESESMDDLCHVLFPPQSSASDSPPRAVAVKRKAPALSHGTDYTAKTKRSAVFAGPIHSLLSHLPDDDAQWVRNRVYERVEQLWELLQKAGNFDSQCSKMRPDVLALVAVYSMREGLSLPLADGREVEVMPVLEELLQLPDMRSNGMVPIARCTVAKKALLYTLNAIDDDALCAWSAEHGRPCVDAGRAKCP